MTNYYDTINWIYLETISEMGITVVCYISEDHKLMKQEWNDGFVEKFMKSTKKKHLTNSQIHAIIKTQRNERGNEKWLNGMTKC